jgi:hypothetical protein
MHKPHRHTPFITLLLVLALGCLPTSAQASEKVTFKVGFSPYQLGRTTTIDVDVRVAGANGELPAPATAFDLHIPAELELISSTLGLAICQPQALLDSGLNGCSPNARLGVGSASVAVPFGPEILQESATIHAIMGPPVGEQIGVLLYAESSTPVLAQLVFPGVLYVGTSTIGQSLNTVIPLIPTLPGAPDTSLTDMNLNIGPNHLTYYKKVHGRTVGYRPQGIALPAVCPRHGFRFVSDLAFQDGTTQEVTSTIPCPSQGHREHHRA